MLQIDLSQAVSFLDEENLTAARERAENAHSKIQKAGRDEQNMMGWHRILSDPNDAVLEQINSVSDELRREIDVLVVCGIGGSYLGAKALIDALTPFFNEGSRTEVVYAGHQISGSYLQDLLGYLEEPKADGTPKQVAVNVISKSGTTLETMLAFRKLRDWMHNRFSEEATKRIICTTSKKGGKLNQIADRYNYRRFILPDDIGGRYSVLTPVGLLPAAVAGIDIQTLVYGAVSCREELELDPDDLLNYASVYYAFEQKQEKTMDVLASFEPELNGFCQWLQQLLAESEGKDERGIFPVVAQYSTDLHSLGQYIQQGDPSMIETFIEVQNKKQSIIVEEKEQNIDQLNYLADKPFHQINQKALQATRAAHYEGKTPCITISLDRVNEQVLGSFIYFYELFTAVYCSMVGVDPFNQPGVENYKNKMYKILGRDNEE
jgi:glucose-6-phosphate isomerase